MWRAQEPAPAARAPTSASARGADLRDRRARRRPAADSRAARSSPRCRCRTPAADKRRARRALAHREQRCAGGGWRRRRQRRPASSAGLRERARTSMTSVSTTASSKPRRRRRASCRRASRSRSATTTAVLSPLKLKSSPGRSVSGRGKRNTGRPRSRAPRARPAGVAEAEQLRGLVEGLAGGVVERIAEDLVAPEAPTTSRAACARPRPAAPRTGSRGRVRLEQRGQQMPLQVMHAERRARQGIGETAGDGAPDQQRADESRARGVGDPRQDPRPALLVEQFLQQRQQLAEMIARGELGHHPAVRGVQVDLAVDLVRSRPRSAS